MAADGETAPAAPDGPRPDRKERILAVLGDATARHILAMLDREPRSVQEMFEADHIPQSTLYRRLHELRELGLVGIQSSVLTPDAKRQDLFRSLVKEVQLTLRGDHFDLRVRYRDLSAERLESLWGKLREESQR